MKNLRYLVHPIRRIFKERGGEVYYIVSVSVNTNSELRVEPWVKCGLVFKEGSGITKKF